MKSSGKVEATDAPNSNGGVPAAGRGGSGEGGGETEVADGAKMRDDDAAAAAAAAFTKTTATEAAATREVRLDCADGGGGKKCAPTGAEGAPREGASTKETDCACPQGETNGGGRGDEARGVVARSEDGAIAVAIEEYCSGGETGSTGAGAAERGHPPNVSPKRGTDRPAGTDDASGGVAAEGLRPPAAWASSKRPRTEEAGAGAL